MMSRFRLNLVTTVLAGLLLAAARQAPAETINNNSPSKATKLPPGQWVVHDDLNGNVGRPDTLLGISEPTFGFITGTDDNSSPVGNGFASKLTGVPLRSNGSAYFKVTGVGDNSFIGNHSQSGRYSILYELFDAQGNLFKTMPVEFEDVNPGMWDNIWLDPPLTPEPQRIGGTVNVTLNNIVGPGTGDSLDFFLFSGLLPFQEFVALVTDAQFDARVGLFNPLTGQLLSTNADEVPGVAGIADALGRALIGVSGGIDTQFKGAHAEVGTYTVEVIPMVVPEPSSAILWGLCGALGLRWARRRRRGRRAPS